MRLVRPFLTVLEKHPAIPLELLSPLMDLDPDERFPASVLMELLRGAIELTGDENLGLHAAEAATLGDYDVLEYAASSCATGREAVEVIGRYIALVDESADFSVEERDGKGYCWMRSLVPLTRPAADFQMATFYRAVNLWLGSDPPFEMEVWFGHEAPDDPSEYGRVFAGSKVIFGAPVNAFIVDASLLDIELGSADPKLNTVLRRHADQLLAELPSVDELSGSVRRLVTEMLAGRKLSADRVAGRLNTSRRTLHRRLKVEGTTFRELVDDQRRSLAMRYMEKGSLSVGEISFLLGFSDVVAFHRAFKRWTGLTPQQYRRSRVHEE